MCYNDLYLELEKLLDEPFSMEFIHKISNILFKVRQLYFADLKMSVTNSKEKYDQFIFLVDDFLKSKIKWINENLSNSEINNIANCVENCIYNINDILKIDNYILIKNSPTLSFSNKEFLTITDNNLKDISSDKFLGIYDSKKNYINSVYGKKVIENIINILNKYLKEYFNLNDNVLIYENGYINYNIPMMNVYLNVDLNTICENIVDNDISNIEVLTTYDSDEIHLFNLKLNMDKYFIEEINSDIWRLSEQNNKRRVK